jgi:hypothetical protein
MPEITDCVSCGIDVQRHGFPRYLDWAGVRVAFCSYLCEFLWRRRQALDRMAQKAPERLFRH